MGLRTGLANGVMSMARSVGNLLGCEVAVMAGGQELDINMVRPSTDGELAWDDTMYVAGNLYHDKYANPVKLTANVNASLEDPDTVGVEASDDIDVDQSDEPHVSVISSERYKLYMVQDLVSQLLNPSERLKQIAIVMAIMGAFVLLQFVLILAIAGKVGVY